MATGLEKHTKALKALEGRKVEAGWFESDKYPSEDGNPGRSVAQNARLHEFGATITVSKGGKTFKIVIPARPAMRLAWSNFSRDRNEIQRRIAKKLIRGEITPDQALGQIGLALEGYIAKSIRNGPWVPNAPKTIAKKGFDKPLIDSGHMWKTVSSKVS